MSVNQKIIAALKPIGVPVVPDTYDEKYDGKSAAYCTFNYTTIPAEFGDDAPRCERYLIQVHFFCPERSKSLEQRGKMKRLLFQAGFTWPEEVNATNTVEDKDKRMQHFVFECETVEGIGYG